MVHKIKPDRLKIAKERLDKLLKFNILDKIGDFLVVGKDPEKLPRVGFIGLDYRENEWVVGNIKPPYEEVKNKDKFLMGIGVAQYVG